MTFYSKILTPAVITCLSVGLTSCNGSAQKSVQVGGVPPPSGGAGDGSPSSGDSGDQSPSNGSPSSSSSSSSSSSRYGSPSSSSSGYGSPSSSSSGYGSPSSSSSYSDYGSPSSSSSYSGYGSPSSSSGYHPSPTDGFYSPNSSPSSSGPSSSAKNLINNWSGKSDLIPSGVKWRLTNVTSGASGKKGGALFNNDNLNKLTEAKVSWWYNWSAYSNSTSTTGPEFVTMVQTVGIDDKTLSDIKNAPVKVVLAFNEPDRNSITVDQAVQYWPKLVALGKRLGSPAVADANGQWLKDFMSKNLQVDFIAVHAYSDATDTGAVDALKKTLTDLHKTYNKPIWLTEFGAPDCLNHKDLCPSNSNPKALTQDAVNTFMTNAVTMLNGLSFVERYAWFALGPKDGYDMSALYNSSGAITGTGTTYKGLGN